MKKYVSLIALCVLTAASFCPSISYASNASVARDTLNNMENSEDEFLHQKANAESNYSKAEADFNHSVRASEAQAASDKRALENRFAKMKYEFQNGSNSDDSLSNDDFDKALSDYNKSKGNISSNSGSNGGVYMPSASSSSSLHQDDGNTPRDKLGHNAVGHVTSRLDANDVEYVGGSETVGGETDGDAAKNRDAGQTALPSTVITSDGQQGIPQESFAKFVVAVIVIFMVMAILYFNGKKQQN